MSNLEEWSMPVDDEGQEKNKINAKESMTPCSSSDAGTCGTCRCGAGAGDQ